MRGLTIGLARRHAAVIAAGAFSAWFASFRGVGKLPLQFLLKERLGVTPTVMSSFFLVAGLAFYFKPLPGLLSDRVRVGGGRRRPWIAWSALAGAVLWGLVGVLPARVAGLLILAAAINVAAAIGDACTAGLLVDEGLSRGGAGRLVALRHGAVASAIVLAWLAGGWLSGGPVGWLGAAGAAPLLALAVMSSRWLRERPSPERAPPPALALLSSGVLWRVAVVVLVFNIAPSFQTVLYFHQRDTLHFSGPQIGLLNMLNGGAGMLAALAYAALGRRLDLRALLIAGTCANALSQLFYLAYGSLPAALAVEIGNGLVGSLGILAIHHLAARAAPRGSEALIYATFLAIEKLVWDLSDLMGAHLHDRLGLSLRDLCVINAAGTALTLLVLPVLPAALSRGRDSPA